MKKTLIYIVFSFLAIELFSQTATYISFPEMIECEAEGLDTTFSTKFFRLYLDDEYYALEVHYFTTFNYNHKHDIHDSTFLSFGKHFMLGEKILMCDSLNGFPLEASFESAQKLRFYKGFGYIIGKQFFYNKTISPKVIDIVNPIVFESQLEEDVLYNEEVYTELRFGYYLSSFKKLHLTTDGRYVFMNQFPKDTISIGSWQREGYFISFQDDSLNIPFYAVLKGEGWWNSLTVPTMPSMLFDNHIVDNQFIYTGFDASGPSKEDLTKPMMGDNFINAMFKCNLTDSQYAFLEFYESIFSIEIWYVIDDILLHKTIAYGNFEKNDKSIDAIDINGYKMKFELSTDTTLCMTSGFCHWIGNTFNLVDKTWHYPEYTYFGDIEDIDYPFDVYRTQEPNDVEMTGNYHLRVDPSCHIDLNFTAGDRFNLNIWGLSYLHGAWIREGNLLILQDDCIKQPFYLIINENEFMPYLPGLFGKNKFKTYNEK